MKNIKKILALVLVAVFAIGMLAACGGSSDGGDAPAGSGSANADGKKTYRIATDITFAPFCYIDNDESVGVDIDLIYAIAEDQGFEIDLHAVGWDAAIAECQAGQADGMIAGASITDNRKANGWIFSDGYYNDSQCMAVATDSDLKGFDDLKGKNVVVKNGTMSDSYATGLSEEYGFTVVRVDDDASMYLQVTGGQAVACFNDKVVLQQAINKGNELKIVDGTENEGAQYGFAIHDSSKQELIDLFNAGLANLKANGKYDEILAKWFS